MTEKLVSVLDGAGGNTATYSDPSTWKNVKGQAIAAINDPQYTQFCLYIAGPGGSNMISISDPNVAAMAGAAFLKKAMDVIKVS